MIWAIIVVMVWLAGAAKFASDAYKRRYDDAKRADAILTPVRVVTPLDEVLNEIYNR